MRRLAVTTAVAATLASSAFAGGKLRFEYALEQERNGQVQKGTFMAGFEMRLGLQLRVTLKQPSYVYMVSRDADGRFSLTFPDTPAPAARISASARIPAITFVRFSSDEGVERLFLIVASDSVPELDEALTGDRSLSEAAVLAVRDGRQGPGRYSRKLNRDGVEVTWRPEGDRPAVLVEEIALRQH